MKTIKVEVTYDVEIEVDEELDYDEISDFVRDYLSSNDIEEISNGGSYSIIDYGD